MTNQHRSPAVEREQPVVGLRRSHHWPTYLVSAAHGVSLDPQGSRVRTPYGLWHARRVGSLQTACGLAAVTWQYFWTLRFDQAGDQACPRCQRVVGHA